MNINGFKIIFLIEHNKYYIRIAYLQLEILHLASPRGLFLAPFFSLFSSMIFHPAFKHSNVTIYADDTVIYVAGKDTFIIETTISDKIGGPIGRKR